MRLGIIGGTGAGRLFGDEPADAPARAPVATPWGLPSAGLRRCRMAGHELIFLPRHGDGRGPQLAPHRVNYRANIWALREAGVEWIVGINAVGGIASWAAPGTLVLPDQLIDYTWGRHHSYGGEQDMDLQHVDFTTPFDEGVRAALVAAALRLAIQLPDHATYGVTQGPRLETAAEIDRLERDGCQIVGMTAMPEAALARELGLPYAICAVVVNRAAGRAAADTDLYAGIASHLDRAMPDVQRLVGALLPSQ